MRYNETTQKALLILSLLGIHTIEQLSEYIKTNGIRHEKHMLLQAQLDLAKKIEKNR